MRMRASFNPCLRRWASALTVSGGGRDRAEGVGLAAAASAAHRQHRKALARDEPGDDVARLLEADVDLHREAGRAEPALVERARRAWPGRRAAAAPGVARGRGPMRAAHRAAAPCGTPCTSRFARPTGRRRASWFGLSPVA